MADLYTKSKEFWCAPQSLDDGPGAELSFSFDLLDLELQYRVHYIFRSFGQQVVNGMVLSQKMDVQSHPNDVGVRISVPYPTRLMEFTGSAHLISTPLGQLTPWTTEPVPHQIYLKIGHWISFRVVREMSRVLVGRSVHGTVADPLIYSPGPRGKPLVQKTGAQAGARGGLAMLHVWKQNVGLVRGSNGIGPGRGEKPRLA
jgi:hypothetical protein